MNNVRVKGFNDITFWQDSGIGLIVLRSDDNGLINWNAINELVAAIGTASIDDKVKSIAVTGMNEHFSVGLKADSTDFETAKAILESANSLISLIYSLEKPVFSVLSGDAIDAGYELALLGDVVISHEENRVGFNRGYNFSIGGSITVQKFRNKLDLCDASEGSNVDVLLPKDKLLDEAKKYILNHQDYSYHLLRRRSMRGLRESILEERENFLRQFGSA
ncbi:hypothetical protein IX51_11390 [uncultured archaeon]|nr:hypothetical protein IX51_11390 [uncultured archaeon]HKJ97101.1 enoyl-CoA hydratase/isomerase family protein [Thermoplasmataceae archaeon]